MGPTSRFTMRQQVYAVVSETPSLDCRSRREPALAGAVHAEFWRRSSEGPYQCFSCNEKNDRGSISFWDPEPCLCHTSVLVSNSSKTRSWLDEVALVQWLGRVAIFLRT